MMMTLYLDIHRNQTEATAEEVAKAHISDLEAQDKHGVKYLKYWFNQENSTICCLIDAPSKDACCAVHQAAHGNLADDIIEVESDMLASFFGPGQEDKYGCALNRDGKLDGGFRTICFTDIVNSTKLTQQLGDAKAMELLKLHDKLTRESLGKHNGSEIKHTGDGIMASFVSALDSVEFAKELQNQVQKESQTENLPLQIRIGICAGEPISDNHDLFGAAVQMAARMCDAAAPSQTLVSKVVYDLCLGKGIDFKAESQVEAKGFSELVQTFSVPYDK